MNDKLKSYLVANDLKYINRFGLIYNMLISIRGRAVISVYYLAHNDDIFCFFLRRMLKVKYHFEVGKNVDLGIGLILHHPYNIIIDSNVSIGDNCQIDQNVTIGGNMKKFIDNGISLQTRPIIGHNVILCASCVVAGPIMVNDNCIIGANATLTFNIEEGTIVSNVNKVSEKKIKVNNGSYKIN
ncbi:Serine acetyltransferase [Flavobacterium gillisiae]|uniref:Serine acetyltransferase n=1 Tax=Flavobacterium gillisiae TaxID=150146 RepID=A0A1H3ZQL5_9FLAO|nr:hypothetical protein [Flavobacterium gillisiae]SEA25989.1 Serine acetyltransferase [Flavobacterium gillisiae]